MVGLAKAHEADERGLRDARPSVVPPSATGGSTAAAVELDGDDWLALPFNYEPRAGGLTLLALLTLTEDATEMPEPEPGAKVCYHQIPTIFPPDSRLKSDGGFPCKMCETRQRDLSITGMGRQSAQNRPK